MPLLSDENCLLTLYHTVPTFNEHEEEAFENIGNQHFLFFPQCFLSIPKQISILKSHLFSCLQMLSIWTGLKICCLLS